MSRRHRPRPTDAELAVLAVLWELGPSTVRDVHGRLVGRGVGYTTVLKTLQIMMEKRLVGRDESARAHVYSATYTREAVQRHLVRDLLDRAFEGSALRLVQQALSAKRASPEDLEEIRRLLAKMQKEEG